MPTTARRRRARSTTSPSPGCASRAASFGRWATSRRPRRGPIRNSDCSTRTLGKAIEAGGARGRRRQVRRRVRGRHLPDRLGDVDEHERQRGDRHPRHRDPRRRARRQEPGASERSREHGAEHQRRLPHRHPRRGDGCGRDPRCCRRCASWPRRSRPRPTSSTTSSRRRARTCRMPCRSRSGQEFSGYASVDPPRRRAHRERHGRISPSWRSAAPRSAPGSTPIPNSPPA